MQSSLKEGKAGPRPVFGLVIEPELQTKEEGTVFNSGDY